MKRCHVPLGLDDQRIKNSLQIITSFVSFEIRRAADPCVEGHRAIQARIGAVHGASDRRRRHDHDG
jgi:two-component sensor histidine kinase